MALFSLQGQISAATATESTSGFYARNVKVARMTLKDEKADFCFKILPAFDTTTVVELADGSIQVDPMSMVTFKDAAGNNTDWARYIMVAPFTGHGPIGARSSRRDLISLKSYDPQAWCPLQELIRAVNARAEWRYLVEDQEDEASPGDRGMVRERAALNSRLSHKLIFNIINTREPQLGVQLAELPTSAIPSLFGDRGLAVLPNMTATEAEIAQNPMRRWAVGDLTDPARGPVLRLRKDVASGKGKFAGYLIEIATVSGGVNSGRPMTFTVEPGMLAQRYNILDLNTIAPRPTEEQMVATLVALFNQWNPGRTAHEYELLRELFGHQYRIPEAPMKGSVQGFGPAPAAAMPAQQQTSQYPSFGSQQAPHAPAVPPQRSAAVPGLPKAFTPPPMPEMQDYRDEEFAPPKAAAVPASPRQAQPQMAPAPGDPVPKYDRESFLSKLRDGNKK